MASGALPRVGVVNGRTMRLDLFWGPDVLTVNSYMNREQKNKPAITTV